MSNQAKHTPGPWQYSFEGGTVAFITEDDGTTVAKLSVTENSTAHSALTANARLIAAAPDLLAALQDALKIVDAYRRVSGGDGDISAMNARAAIAKATGEQK